MDNVIDANFDKDYPEETHNLYLGSLYDIYKKAFESGNKVGFNVGYAAACATMIKQHDQPTMVQDCFWENFNTVQQLKEIGVEEFDISVLRPIIKEIQRKRKLNKH